MSLHSSGVAISAHDEERRCDACEHEAVVEVVDDPEIHESWWECPNCGAPHSENI